ncbi:hypothetical protein B0H10DRAFT_2221900 [Mycena sp. CBHHK59/15]|nr:hypothetical protein B0H10DRAFT_2221900 [Mycena sp. CBHHK59/15]
MASLGWVRHMQGVSNDTARVSAIQHLPVIPCRICDALPWRTRRLHRSIHSVHWQYPLAQRWSTRGNRLAQASIGSTPSHNAGVRAVTDLHRRPLAVPPRTTLEYARLVVPPPSSPSLRKPAMALADGVLEVLLGTVPFPPTPFARICLCTSLRILADDGTLPCHGDRTPPSNALSPSTTMLGDCAQLCATPPSHPSKFCPAHRRHSLVPSNVFEPSPSASHIVPCGATVPLLRHTPQLTPSPRSEAPLRSPPCAIPQLDDARSRIDVIPVPLRTLDISPPIIHIGLQTT